MIVPKSLIYMCLLPAVIEGGIRGLRSADQIVHRSLQMEEDVEDDLDIEYCKPVPIMVDEFGLEHFLAEKFLLVYVEGAKSKKVDAEALSTTFTDAYNRRVDCSYSLGSMRALANCAVISDEVEIVDDAVLVKCDEYKTNSADGKVFLGGKPQTCECTCENDGEEQIFKQLVLNEVCDCFCGKPSEQDCICPAPYFDRFVKVWNRLYQEITLNETEIIIADIKEVTILIPEECESGEMTKINGTDVCPGNSTDVFSGK
jgi:hypothetical protein